MHSMRLVSKRRATGVLRFGAIQAWHSQSARNAVLLSLALCLIMSCRNDNRSDADMQALASRVTIYRDAFGVPHVHGKGDADAAFGFAYAQAEDNFWQIEDNFIRALGRAAEVYGEELLLDDWINRALEIPRLSREEYAAIDSSTRALCDGFAAGLNYFLATHPQTTPRLLRRFEPWYPLALIRYLYYQRGFLRATGLRGAAFAAAFRRFTQLPLPELARAEIDEPIFDFAQGSNAWAVAPARSASGHALLFINPHLPFFGPSQVYEGHVISDAGWNFSGYTRFGFPLPYVGFNEHLGWASTDNAADQQDLYIEQFDDPERPLAYRFVDGYRMASEWHDTLRVNVNDTLLTHALTFRKTHHGPLIAIDDNGQLLAVRMAKFEQPGWLSQWYAMTRARSLAEFTSVASRLDMLFGNYLYADREGNILYVYNAAVPRRNPQFDWTRPVDGRDRETEWQGYHRMDELPRLLNPPSGWLQNCNSTPFLSTSAGNPNPADFPRYMVREGDNARGRGARRLLASRDRFTTAQWQQLSYSTYLIQAENDLPLLIDEWQQVAAADPARAGRLTAAVELLQHWDRQSTVASPAMTLYVHWIEARRRQTSPAGERWPQIAALERAIEALQTTWGSWQVAWGEINRLQRVHTSGNGSFTDQEPSLPIAGAPTWSGAMFTFWSRPVEGQKRRYGVGGNSYVAIVEFAPQVRAFSLHVFGSSADPASPHFFDQAPNYASGNFKPAWLTLADVRANAARHYAPGQPQATKQEQ